MLGIEIAGVYIAMMVAIVGGLYLLWSMLVELIHFDGSAYRDRSARIAETRRESAGPPSDLALSVPVTNRRGRGRGGGGVRAVDGAVH